MAFLGVVADLANAAVESYGASYARATPGYPERRCGRGVLGSRDAGPAPIRRAGIRTQTFYQILGNVNLAEQTGFANLGAPLDTIPGPGEVARFLTVRAQGYLYNARYLLQTIDPDTGATATEWRPFSLHYDNLVTRGDACRTPSTSLTSHRPRPP